MKFQLTTAFANPVTISRASWADRLPTRTSTARTPWKPSPLHQTTGETANRRPRTPTRPTIVAVRASPLTIKRPRASKKPTAQPRLTVESDSLQSTPFQRLLLALQVGLTAAVTARAFSHAAVDGLPAIALHVGLVGAAYLLTDLFVGIYHHAVDNYGSERTPIMGFQIAAFQGHHSFPWTITSRDVANNLYRLTMPTIPQTLALLALPLPSTVTTLYASVLFFIVLSQETHRQAHMARPALWARVLQSAGIVISQREHAKHHRGAHDGSYCILSGHWNSALNHSRFFRWLEGVVFLACGVEPICWSLDPQLKTEALGIMQAWRFCR